MKHIALFCNYSLGKRAAELLIGAGLTPVILANETKNDDKFGKGVVQWAHERRIRLVRGNFQSHVRALADLEHEAPLAGLCVAYKERIIPSQLPFPVYGVHFGGLHGREAIRGQSTWFWSQLRGRTHTVLSLYRIASPTIDQGEVLTEFAFELKPDIASNAFAQLHALEPLLDTFCARLTSRTALGAENGVQRPLGAYFPHSGVNGFSRSRFQQHEVEALQRAGVPCRELALEITCADANHDVNEIRPGRDACGEFLYLHGLASSFPNQKLERLVDLLGDTAALAPRIAGIHRGALDEHQSVAPMTTQLEQLVRLAQDHHWIIVASSISCLLVSRVLADLAFTGHVIYLTPVIDLESAALDPALSMRSTGAEPAINGESIALESLRYSGYRMSVPLVRHLQSLSMLVELPRHRYSCDVVLAEDDDIAPAESVRGKLTRCGLAGNCVNILEGRHEFGSVLQLAYLASLIRRAQRRRAPKERTNFDRRRVWEGG